LFDLKNGEEEASWNIIPVVGKNPGQRYGHTMCYMKPYIVVFGGNTVSHPTNEVWIIPLEKSPFSWTRLELPDDTLPSPRLYHASGICTKGNAQGMMIVFGGRDQSENALNDTWGLRRHRDGRWDWVVAPYKGEITPKNRYNVIKKINK
jgi:protein phosphatase